MSSSSIQNAILESMTIQKAKVHLKLISSRLTKHGCCPRCVLRYLGVFKSQLYSANVAELLLALLDDTSLVGSSNASRDPGGPAAAAAVPNVCGSCLGVLQNFCERSFIEKVASDVRVSGYEFRSFACSVSLPVGADLREYSYLLIADEACPDAYGGMKVEDLPSVKDAWRWICSAPLSKLLGAPHEQGHLEVLVEFHHPEADKECNPLVDIFPQLFRQRKNSKWDVFTRTIVRQAMNDMSRDKYRRRMRYPPPAVEAPCTCVAIGCSNPAVYVAGRYNKYSRHLSQTPWLINGKRKSATSVEELVCTRVAEKVGAKEYRFSSSGREDCDVRMLGRGRPFVIELIDPRRPFVGESAMEALQAEINSATELVAVRDLQIVTRLETTTLKEGEEDKKKRYSAWCICREPIKPQDLHGLQQVKDLEILQKTPIRVLHRRPMATRKRVIHDMSAEWLDEHHFMLRLQTQAGTYVKEFVHGDFGRTQPNVRSLIKKECDIITLDVESVDIDWPPALLHRDRQLQDFQHTKATSRNHADAVALAPDLEAAA